MKRKLIPFVVLALLQAADFASTRLAFSIGAVELNPLVRGLGLWPAKLLVCGLIVLLALRTNRARRLWTLCGVYAFIVSSNMAVALMHLQGHAR